MTRTILTSLLMSTCLAGLGAAPAAAQKPAPFAAAVPQDKAAERGAVTLSGTRLTPADAQGEAFGRAVREKIESRKEIAGGRSEAHIVVFFDGPPSADQRAALARMGVTLQKRLGSASWSARVSASGAERLPTVQGVIGGALFPPAAKISTTVSLADEVAYLKRPDGLVFTVLFHDDVSFGEAQAVIERAGGRIEGGSKEAFEGFPSLSVVVKQSGVEALAAYDAVRFVEQGPPPYTSFNRLSVQPLSNVDDVQLPPYSLSGDGETVGVWEFDSVVRDTHQELTPRVTIAPGQTANERGHAMHVAGTIASSGVNTPDTEGMAPAAEIVSWDAAGDFAEMRNASDPANPDIVLSNHSYGFVIGWSGGAIVNSQNFFGRYLTQTEDVDDLVADNGLIVMKSAGNDRGEGDMNGPADPNGPDDCAQNAYPGGVEGDCIEPWAVAKNIITIGAMNGAGAIAPFSSLGPVDDGRIKPDLVAHGVNVLSLGTVQTDIFGNVITDDVPQNDTDTWVASGTSMSSPAVAGIAALVLEEAGDLGVSLDADSMKALLIQTAQDVDGVGQAQAGPDFATGWGIADAQAAADLLRQPGGPGLAEDTIASTGAPGAYVLPFYVPAGEPEMHVTLAWTDPAGNPALAPALPQLVNDLDLRLIAPDGTTVHQPWTLNPADPGQAAVRNGGDDSVNPVEQVSVLTPVSGVWYAQVTAKAGSLVAGPQDFALAGPFLPQSGPIASQKRNLMLVLDRSGSMNMPSSVAGVSKLGAMQNAAKAFTDFIEIVGGHNLGMVQFNSSTVPLSPLFDLQPLDAASAPNAHTTIDNVSAGGLTNIIAGVTDAEAAFGTPAADNPADAVVLFSDGRHNSPWGSDVADIDTVMANDTKFFGIGFGTDVDSSVMPTVAANHDGLWVEEQELNGAELSKLFLLAGGLAVDETIVVDPDYSIAPGAVIQQPAYIRYGDSAITFAVTWNEPEADALDFSLAGPWRDCFVPDKDHKGYQTRQGPGYKLIRVTLPYNCQEGPSGTMHKGDWTLSVKNNGQSDAAVKVMTLAESDLKLYAQGRIEGEQAAIEANLLSGGAPATLRNGRMVAYVPSRLKPQEDSQAVDEEGSRLGEPIAGDGFDYGLKIVQTELNDEGVEGDEVAGDGVYGGFIPYNPSTGMAQMRVVAEGDLDGQPIRREAIASFGIGQ